MVKIGNVSIDGKLVLAPMAGVTDAAFRQLCRHKGAALVVTEMISSRGLMYNDSHTTDLLYIAEDEAPVAVQIFGSEPEIMGEAAQKVIEMTKAPLLDINMGCPVGKVVKSGDGSALMLKPELARDIIEHCVRSAGVPVTVKFRKGWDSGHINAVEFGKMCEEAGASAIAVHGRTRTQMYAGLADRDIIRDVKKAVSIPVIANGDVTEPEDAGRMLERTGADLVMIGRGTFGNPWIFEQAKAFLEGRELPPLPSLSEKIDTAVAQFENDVAWKGEKIACLEARKEFCWYLHGVAHSGYYKKEIVRINTLDDIHRIAKEIKLNLS